MLHELGKTYNDDCHPPLKHRSVWVQGFTSPLPPAPLPDLLATMDPSRTLHSSFLVHVGIPSHFQLSFFYFWTLMVFRLASFDSIVTCLFHCYRKPHSDHTTIYLSAVRGFAGVSKFQQLTDSFSDTLLKAHFQLYGSAPWQDSGAQAVLWSGLIASASVRWVCQAELEGTTNRGDPRPLACAHSSGLQHGVLSPSLLFPMNFLLS